MNQTLQDFLRSPTNGNPSFALEGLLERLCDSIDAISERLDGIEDRLSELTARDALDGLTFKVVRADDPQ